MWLIDGALTCTTIPGQSGTRSNGNEAALNIPQSSRISAHY